MQFVGRGRHHHPPRRPLPPFTSHPGTAQKTKLGFTRGAEHNPLGTFRTFTCCPFKPKSQNETEIGTSIGRGGDAQLVVVVTSSLPLLTREFFSTVHCTTILTLPVIWASFFVSLAFSYLYSSLIYPFSSSASHLININLSTPNLTGRFRNINIHLYIYFSSFTLPHQWAIFSLSRLCTPRRGCVRAAATARCARCARYSTSSA